MLTNGACTLVDDDDYGWVIEHIWCFHTGYAARKIKINGKLKRIFMHRLINHTPANLETDHINGDKLDNRKTNLRSCDNARNQQNRQKASNKSSKYKGVHWHIRDHKWVARIRVNGNQISLGTFQNEITAAYTYNIAAKEYFGEFARLNIL